MTPMLSALKPMRASLVHVTVAMKEMENHVKVGVLCPAIFYIPCKLPIVTCIVQSVSEEDPDKGGPTY